MKETWINQQSPFEPKPTLRASSVFAARPHFADAVAAVAVAASDSDTGQGQSHCSIASDNKCDCPNGAKLCTASGPGGYDEGAAAALAAAALAAAALAAAATAATLLTGPAGPAARRHRLRAAVSGTAGIYMT